jgi:hypothetical protein
VALSWADLLFVGLAGNAGSERDIATNLYSIPELLIAAVVVTLLIPLPISFALLAHRQPPVTAS